MDQDADRKTHPPSKRKLLRARRKGEVAHSRELTATAAVAGVCGMLWLSLPGWLESFGQWTRACFAGGGLDNWRPALDLLLGLVGRLGGAAVLAAVVVGLGQVGIGWCWRFDLKRLDPLAGLKRQFSRQRLADLGWLAGRVAVLTACGTLCLLGLAPSLPLGTEVELSAWAQVSRLVLVRLALVLSIAGLALGALDRCIQRRRFLKRQRMTREEVVRERKEQEGDPTVRAERRRLQRRLLAGVGPAGLGRASVLVVNPTHAAAALRYRPEEDEAPVLLAAGWDEAALRLRRAALELGVPVVEHVALARALAVLEPGAEIPESLYEAAAEVIRALRQLA